ncbi:acyltransferase [Undibacterium sp. Jales W-56]|uniref:acyltransferase family protein n=1 Tax=Undibacterium sp. Jales W-56 TaxID=2897325 RepID=UPI0021D14012|nr:acyltransferase [Undibacterium sp. Jales W-56]MCU6435263.1 acyltransferase [Undibacterium sp. Jales W-56]
MIQINKLSRTNLNDDYLHSFLISLLRALAALEVALAHLRAQLYPGYGTIAAPTVAFQGVAFFTGFAHQAVVVFFLLSGWLVGGSLLNKSGRAGAFRDYAIDRVTRLWIVLIPVFVLTLGVGMVTAKIDPGALSFVPGNEYSATAFLGNLAGLQKIAVPTFGGNFPLWSLSNESWYYILFPLLVITLGSSSTQSRVSALMAALSLTWLLPGPLMLYFSIWLLGVAGSRIDIRTTPTVRAILFLVFAGVAVYFRVHDKNPDMNYQSFPHDLLFSVAFIVFLASTQVRLTPGRVVAKLKGVAKHFADFSFTLYVIHVPLITVVTALVPYLAHNKVVPNDPIHLLSFLGIYVAIVIAAYYFHRPFEANTGRLRAYLKSTSVPVRSSV